jgi:hypothetical protein
VVWHDRRAPRFIGDSPHTWVGSDFLRSAADLFAYERESDSALVLGAGIDEAWLDDSGVRVDSLRTWWGPLSYTVRRTGAAATVAIGEGLHVPPGGVLVMSPRASPLRQALVDDIPATPTESGAIVLRRLPARVVFQY